MNSIPENKPRPSKSKRSRRRKRRAQFLALTTTALIFICILLIALILAANRGGKKPIIEDHLQTHSRYVEHNGELLPNYPDIPVNERDPEAFSYKNGLLYYDDGEVTGQPGIDVSSHQGKIDWEAVADAGVSFAFLRIGYRGYSTGDLNCDECFFDNYEQARKAGIDVGVYFYSQAVSKYEAKHEADFVLSLLDGCKLDLPVVFDWEYANVESARTDEISEDELTEICTAFCEAVESEGYSAAIYFNKSTGYTLYDLGSLSEYDFWIADYSDTPEFYYEHEYWQYSDSGSLDGIRGNVDLNMRFIHH